ncbi:MAG: ABC transporter permease [Flavobacteriales bacterium]|jgi:putative ABC transport system permease protein|nr:ABC transporter permease [Flavobacteriales bacterium]
MVLYLRLLNESFRFAFTSLWNNKLRTFLSLLGVTVGIFSIIAVLTAVDSLDRKIKADLEGLDKNTMYILRFSFGPTEIPQWKREQFPNVKYEEYEMLEKSVSGIDKIAFNLFTRPENIKYESNEVSAVRITPTTSGFEFIDGIKIGDGRFFNESESNSGVMVVVLGYEVAKTLFNQPERAIGQKVRLYGQKFTVIGVTEKQGFSTFGDSRDNAAFIPMNYIRRKYGENSDMLTPAILVKPQKGTDIEELKAEITQKLRTYRGVKFGEIDNFFINVLSGFTDFIDNIIGQLNIVGWSIAFFSLLVGGFGIANIMFVSVKERTNLIGIQKSLGAKNRFILFQFLFEAVILALFGGIIGLVLVALLAWILTAALDFEFILGLKNILIGTLVSAFIGLLSGVIPAFFASRLDPVEAIRTGM